MSNTYTMPPCHLCNGKCCSYFALEIDRPTTLDEFEHIKWYIVHQNTFVFVDDGEWFLQVNNPCKHLGEDHKCTIYDKRPKICREYGFDEDNDVSCDMTTGHIKHDLEFHSMEDVEKHIKKRFPRSKR